MLGAHLWEARMMAVAMGWHELNCQGEWGNVSGFLFKVGPLVGQA